MFSEKKSIFENRDLHNCKKNSIFAGLFGQNRIEWNKFCTKHVKTQKI